jgi:hypothetical protein
MSDMLHNTKRKSKGENFFILLIFTARNDAYVVSVCRVVKDTRNTDSALHKNSKRRSVGEFELRVFQPWVQTNRNKINSKRVRERFQRWVRHTQRNPGLETLG